MENKFQKWLEENSITEVECLVPDLGGIARGKIVPTKKFIKGLENDIWVYQNHECPEAICPECDEIPVKVEDDTWQDTKPEMGTAVKDAVEAFKDDTVLLPITNNRIFS